MTPDTYRVEHETIEAVHTGEDDFKNQWGLAAVRAQLDLEHGAGTGQIVGLIDAGIDTGHQVSMGKEVHEHFLPDAPDETGDRAFHGTAVTSIIAGRPSDSFTAGVTARRGFARSADVAMFALSAGLGGGQNVPISLADLASADDTWASRISHVTTWSMGGRSLDFVNMSVDCKGFMELYSAQEPGDRQDGLRVGDGQREWRSLRPG